MTAVNYTVSAPNETTARLNYAKWFVREHFLPQDYEKWKFRYPNIEHVEFWQKILKEKAIRWFKLDDEAGYRVAREAWYRSHTIGFSHHDLDNLEERYGRWWRVELDDIDLEINDDNHYVQEARRARKAHQDDVAWQWLIKEAEYQRVYWEALVRSYGVDVHTP